MVNLLGSFIIESFEHPENDRFSIIFTPSGKYTLLRLVQPLKQDSPILLTFSGRYISSRELQFSKALFPISTKDFGNCISTSEVQPLKAETSRDLTPSGIINFFRILHPANALTPIFMTVLGIIYVSSVEQYEFKEPLTIKHL